MESFMFGSDTSVIISNSSIYKCWSSSGVISVTRTSTASFFAKDTIVAEYTSIFIENNKGIAIKVGCKCDMNNYGFKTDINEIRFSELNYLWQPVQKNELRWYITNWLSWFYYILRTCALFLLKSIQSLLQELNILNF